VNYFVVAQSIAENGTVALEKNEFVPLDPGPDGAYYSKFGIAQSVLEAPFYLIGKVFAPRDEIFRYSFLYLCAVMSVPFISSLTIILFLLAAIELGFKKGASLAAAVLLGTATMIWPYSRFGFSEPLQAFALTGAVLFAFRTRTRGTTLSSMLCGTMLGILILTKSANLLAAPALAVYIYLQAGKTTRERIIHRASFAAPLIIFLAFLLLYNDTRYGSPFVLGYSSGRDAEFGFGTPFAAGLYGFLLSPGKSIFLYSPVIIAALAGIPAFHRRNRGENFLIWAIVVPVMLMYSCWWAWHGDWCWGPRFFVPVIPLVMIPLLPVLESLPAAGRVTRASFGALVAVSVFIQVLGVTVNFYEYIMIARHQVPYNIFYVPDSPKMRDDQLKVHFIPDFSPVAGHAWLLRHTLLHSKLPAEKLRAEMQKDFPWRNLMDYAPPQRPETGAGFDAWWNYYPRFFPESAQRVKIFVTLLCIASVLSLAAAALLFPRGPAGTDIPRS